MNEGGFQVTAAVPDFQGIFRCGERIGTGANEWVAEPEGFEPSIRLYKRITV